MRRICSLLSNLLILAALGGLLLLAVQGSGPLIPATSGAGMAIEGLAAPTEPGWSGGTPASDGPAPTLLEAVVLSAAAPLASATATPALLASLPITTAAIPRIALETAVVSAAFVERDGGTTWEVPAFKAGHAQHTAGAGERGNAVLLGHVSSRNAGNVFKDLDRVQGGDLVHVFSGERRFEYRVLDVRALPRTDLSSVHPTETATLSLITCTGLWLPTIWDYTERLVVRAELIDPPLP
ncbi:MAG: sortase [Chloroflexi bacterium]|nr:sortase [Chloroflexota bacterium]